MNVSDSTVAIIGTGNIGSTLAANFAAGGQKFLLAGREQEKARKLASGLRGYAAAVSLAEAVGAGGLLVTPAWVDGIQPLICPYRDALASQAAFGPPTP